MLQCSYIKIICYRMSLCYAMYTVLLVFLFMSVQLHSEVKDLFVLGTLKLLTIHTFHCVFLEMIGTGGSVLTVQTFQLLLLVKIHVLVQVELLVESLSAFVTYMSLCHSSHSHSCSFCFSFFSCSCILALWSQFFSQLLQWDVVITV